MSEPSPPVTPPAPAQQSRRDRLIPWYFVAAFALLIVVDGTMAYMAISTNPGTVTDEPYQRGLAYNDYLQEAKAQAARGWQGALHYENEQLTFKLSDKQGAALPQAEVQATIMRPVEAGHDQSLTLHEVAPGMYAAPLVLAKPGIWNVRIFATWNKQPFALSRNINNP